MKLRTGFVSNSSSSSFVLITTEKNWDQAKQDLSAYQVAVGEALMSTPTEFLGQKVVKFSTWENHGGSWSDYLEVDVEPPDEKDEYGDQVGVYDAFEKVAAALKAGGDVLTHRKDTG